MIQLGITGGIGAGKSIICRIFEILGVPVYNADLRARSLMNEDIGLMKALISVFGDTAYKEGQLNRSWLAQQVFHNSENLQKLNGLVHPAVARDYHQWLSAQTSAFTIKEAALLVETGSYRELDAIIVVTASLELRIQRVLQRDRHRSPNDVRAIIGQQMKDEDKVKVADFIIKNDEIQPLIPQVLKIYDEISGKNSG